VNDAIRFEHTLGLRKGFHTCWPPDAVYDNVRAASAGQPEHLLDRVGLGCVHHNVSAALQRCCQAQTERVHSDDSPGEAFSHSLTIEIANNALAEHDDMVAWLHRGRSGPAYSAGGQSYERGSVV
jgi:hypothetical protein